MSSTTSSLKRIEKVSSDNIVISYDLITNLTYLSCLAAANLPRETMLSRAGAQTLKTAVIFEQVYLMAQQLGLEYVQSLQLVAEKARADALKSLLLRFASTIASGESEHFFIREETRVEGQRYTNEYHRSVENLKKWTDAYAALLVSVTLIVVVGLVSTMTGTMGPDFVLVMAMAMFFITCVGVYVILRSAPYEDRDYTGEDGGPPDRKRARFFLFALGVPGLMLCMILWLTSGMGVALLVFGIFLFPAGFFANRDDKKTRSIDGSVAGFVRALGNVAGATGGTLSSAIDKLDLKSMGRLEPHILRLKTRLAGDLPTDICWERFKAETGNELVRRSTTMLVDGVELGGQADELADITSRYAGNIAELREIRHLTASSFNFLALPMHAAMTGLLVFIFEIIRNFNTKLDEVASEVIDEAQGGAAAVTQVPGLQMFASVDLGKIGIAIGFVILVLTIANALAPKFAAGGHNMKIAHTLSITSIISGFNLIVVPKVAAALFGG